MANKNNKEIIKKHEESKGNLSTKRKDKAFHHNKDSSFGATGCIKHSDVHCKQASVFQVEPLIITSEKADFRD